MSSLSLPPLSLYIHIPWCVRKCPYCDFNSHQSPDHLPIDEYVAALLADLVIDKPMAQGRKISSIFFGGGTPSLFPAHAIASILQGVERIIGIADNAEITLEANPGTAENYKFVGLTDAGVNRLSIGVQSFRREHLQELGRIHSGDEAVRAYDFAVTAGFNNINIDLMHGLPQQTCAQAVSDLEQAIALGANHISWYQLTIEPNTIFYRDPPRLPVDDTLLDIQEAGHDLLSAHGFAHYEVSAYCRDQRFARHNLNYWQFGDYLAIGAGAHGKITYPEKNQIQRFQKTRKPEDYLDVSKIFTAKCETLESSALPLEFMMNALRLNLGLPWSFFAQRTGLKRESLSAQLEPLYLKGLMVEDVNHLQLTNLGQKFLNDVLEVFMD